MSVFALDALGTLFPRLQKQGVERLIVARVLWRKGSLALYESVLPGTQITVVRLTAPLSIIESRLRSSEIGSGLDWHLAPAAELDAHWRAHPVEDLLVETSDRSVRSIGHEILSAVDWI